MYLRKKFMFVVLTTVSFVISACGGEDPIDNAVKTDGTFNASVSTSSYNGQYAPHNVVAIWIESNSGTFVKSLVIKAAQRKSYLTNWLKSSGGSTTDATTGATVNNHNSTYNVSWNGKNSAGTTVGDGTYKLCVEFTENNGTGKFATFTFAKGTVTDSQTPGSKSNVTVGSLSWTPAGVK